MSKPSQIFDRDQEWSDLERFANAFSVAYLMPAAGLSRRYNEIQRSRNGRVTPADLCTLADYYGVSVEALSLRLEDLRLLPTGTWDRLKLAGFRVREAQTLLGLRNRQSPSRFCRFATSTLPPRRTSVVI